MHAASTFTCVLCPVLVTLAVSSATAFSQGTEPQPTLTLSSAWRMAIQNDPAYQAAISEREAGQANRAIGRAALLPQVNASLGRSKVRGTLEAPNAIGASSSSDLNYMSSTNEIRGTQTVFNWSRFAEYRQGHARADHSLAVFATKADDTSLRLISRYFQTLLSFENMALAKARLQSSEKQIMVAQRRFDGGEGTITDVRESRSRRDLARAELIRTEDALIVAQRELQEMLGQTPMRLTMLRRDFEPRALMPATRAQWQAMAMMDNSEIQSFERGLRVSAEEIDRTFGGHLPTLELVAAYRKVDGETVATRDQRSTTTSVGIQVVLPVFSGGLTSAQVRQARHNRDRAAQELAATRERVAVDVTRQYQAVVSGAQRIRALVTAVASSIQALKAIEMGFQAGTRSIADILDAEDRMFQSRLDLTQARLQYVLARLTLVRAAGHLNAATIDAASATFFGPEHIVLIPSR